MIAVLKLLAPTNPTIGSTTIMIFINVRIRYIFFTLRVT